MFSRTPASFTLSDLQRCNPANNNWFAEDSPAALAGRCLLDAMEYLRTISSLPGRFVQLTNAHTIRLVCRCLSDKDLNRLHALENTTLQIEDTCRHLRAARNERAPHYGDDFWDWAAILEAFGEVQGLCLKKTIDDVALNTEFDAFYDSVKTKIPNGLTMGNAGEWYGPATATIAHRVLRRFRKRFKRDAGKMLTLLREQALQPVEDNKYRGHTVEHHHLLWHYGQVVAEFPRQDTLKQAKTIDDLSQINQWSEKSERVYALARVLQGAHHVGQKTTIDEAMRQLYECETTGRPFGTGLMADNVKGSLNVLDALWPMLGAGEKARIGSMIDTLQQLHIEANTVGIVVAVDREVEAAKKAFKEAGASIETRSSETTIVTGTTYRVVICKGKAVVGVTDATRTLIDEHKAKWLIIVGIAGSLGTLVRGKKSIFRGADKGHVVIAASIAPFRIRDKVREHIENAKVPLRGKSWMIIPTDPMLFGLAHEAGDELYGEDSGRFHEGLIVTGTGIKDALKAKKDILKDFPGGIAVEEEGYVVGLLCLVSEMPYLIVRGISDRAQGDKKKQGRKPKIEKAEQFKASLAAARVAVRVVKLLSRRW
jgi:nucleoside phosphorylase